MRLRIIGEFSKKGYDDVIVVIHTIMMWTANMIHLARTILMD